MRGVYAIGAGPERTSMEGGEVGRALLAKRSARHRLEEHSLPPGAFCPVDWWDAAKLVAPAGAEPPGAHAVHFWNEVWRYKGMDKDGAYPADSLYEILKRRDGVRV